MQDADANGIGDGLDVLLNSSRPSDRFNVIVTFTGPAAHTRARTQAASAGSQDAFSLIPGFKAQMTAAQIRGLASTPSLLRIEEDQVVELALDAADRDFGTEAARQQFGVDGSGVGICIIDTGVDSGHEQLDGGKVAGWLDLVSGLTTPYDDQGHGTHVASIAAGDGTGTPAAGDYQGVAPGASVYAVKVFSSSGQASESIIIEGLEWCVDQPDVQIISMSISTTTGSDGADAMSLAANAAVDAGKIVVVAAGNIGDRVGSVGSPGAAEKVITVGAVAEFSAPEGAPNHSKGVYLAPFSSRGPTLGPSPETKPDVVAPGVSITAAQFGTSSGYVTQSGTSMATPFTAGALALAIEAAGGSLTNQQAKSLIADTSQDRGAEGKDNDFGWGLLDGIALVGEAAGAAYTPYAFPPSIDVAGSVPDEGTWRMTFEVAEADLNRPIAATVLIDGQEDCLLFLLGFCLLTGWNPDLAARLIDPTGAVLDTNNCQSNGDCGNVGRQELVAAMPTIAGTYTLEVLPTSSDPNNGKGGDFIASLSNGVLIAIEAEEPTPLVGHWSLNETSGEIAADDSGNQHDGTLVNGPLWRPGIVDGALEFDGSNERVDLPGDALNGVRNMTLALWVQTTKTGMQGIVSAANSGNSNEMLLFLNSDTEVRFYTGTDGTSYVAWSVPSLADGAWHHLAVTRDADAGLVTLYLDGLPQTSQSATLASLGVVSNGFLLGQEQDAVGGGFQSSQAFSGAMDEVWLYRLILSETEIAALASAAGDSTPPSVPGNLGASLDASTASLGWDGSVDPESGVSTYRIYRGNDSVSPKTLVAQVPGTQTSYSESVTPGLDYHYQVSAVNGHGGESELSNDASVSPDTFIGHWTLDDGVGETALDSSVYSHDGALQNGVVWQSGRLGGAAAFDGGNDRIDLPGIALDGISDLTISTWINTSKTGGQSVISAATSGNDNELLLYLSGTLVQFYTGETTGSRVEWSVPLLADSAWHHLALLRDATGDGVTLYMDGSALESQSTPVSALNVAANGLVLGQEQDSVGGGFQSSQAFSGAIDDLRLYARLLSPAEIADLAAPDDPSPPTAPEDLVTTLPGGYIALTWSAAEDSESGITSYRIYRDTTSGTSKALIGEVPASETTFDDVGVGEGITYFYEVTAVNGTILEGPPSQEASATVEAPLTAHWSLDDAAGTVALDSSGQGSDGTLVNGPTWQDGRIAGALGFDGSNDRVDLPPMAVDGLANVTFSLWLQTTKTGQQAIVSGANSGNDNEVLLFARSATELEFYTGESGQYFVSWTVPSLADGAWHHVAVVRDSLAGMVSLYLDGLLVSSQPATLSPLSVAAGGFLLGQEQDSVGGGFSSSQAFSGALDDVRLYARALTAEQIAELAAPSDLTEPAAPDGLQAVPAAGQVTLYWTPADDPQTGVSLYRIYRDTESGTAKVLIAEVPGEELTYVDDSVTSGMSYFYEVAAVNGDGLEGSRSDEAASSAMADALAAYWALDDGSGNTAFDSSGNGFDGTLVNGPAWGIGWFSGGVEFNAGNQRVDLPSGALDGLNDLTISLWLNTTKSSGQALISGANGSNDNELLAYLRRPTKLDVYTGASAGSEVTWTLPALNDGAWHHLVIVRDAEAGHITVYLDGVSYGDRNANLSAIDIDPSGFVLAQEQDSVGGGFQSSQAFQGTMDDVRLYNRVLTPEEIAALPFVE